MVYVDIMDINLMYIELKENNNSINNNYILDIKEDEDGDIWVATADGLSRIRNNGQSIINYLLDKVIMVI